MKVCFRSGVRVVAREAPIFRDFSAKDFKVLDSGALELSGPERMTLAPGTWVSATFILTEEGEPGSGGSA